MIIENEIDDVLIIEDVYRNVKDTGFECDEKYCDFLNSEDGQTLEKMYELAYGLY